MNDSVVVSRHMMRINVNVMLAKHGRTRDNGKVASHRTTSAKGEILHVSFSNLWDLGYKIVKPENLRHEHIEVLCKHWHEKELAISTIQSRLSTLRIMWRWLGKSGTVKPLAAYLPDIDKQLLIVKKVALTTKSWTGNDIDVIEKIRQADILDRRFGLMLRLDLAFGLRRMEVLQFKPHKSDKGDRIRIYEAKNGRQRDVDIETPEQRAILDIVKVAVPDKAGNMGWKVNAYGKPSTLDQNVNRYNYYMAAIGITRKDAGVTGHGLRAQYAENAALIAQVIPPTLGGTEGQMPKGDLDIKRAQISEKLGHSRISITPAYYGSFGRNIAPDEADRCKNNIEEALQYCHAGVIKPVEKERIPDCLKLVEEMASIDIDMTMRQVQVLWEIHSQRHGHHWIKPLEKNVSAMEAAAISLLQQCVSEKEKTQISVESMIKSVDEVP